MPKYQNCKFVTFEIFVSPSTFALYVLVDLIFLIKFFQVNKAESSQYHLYIIIIHMGNYNGGHYYVLIKDFKTNQWLRFNDESVTVVSVHIFSITSIIFIFKIKFFFLNIIRYQWNIL